MKRLVIILGLVGLAMFIALVIYAGVGEIAAALATAGYGVMAVAGFFVTILIADTLCWRELIRNDVRPTITQLFNARWICNGINTLLPVAQVGGDIVRARMIHQRGTPGAEAGASVVTDVTIGIVTQIVFSIAGFVILLRLENGGAAATTAGIGLAIFSICVLCFLITQRRGMFRIATRLLQRIVPIDGWTDLIGSAETLDAAIAKTYRRRRETTVATVWRAIGWVLGTGEVWLAMYFLGHPVTITEAFMIEALGQAVRNASFLIPGAIGAQEGGFMILAAIVGAGEEIGLAMSLLKRTRELLWGVPAILVWQLAATRAVLSRRNQRASSGGAISSESSATSS